MKILGIDPALGSLGYGVIQQNGPKVQFIDSGLVKTTPQEEMPIRLHHIKQQIADIIEKHQPGMIAMEETFVNKNPSTSLKLGYVRGALMSLFGGVDVPYFEYKPNVIKKTIVGVGHAEKDQVIAMARIVISGAPENLTSDEADALAVAYTCMVHSARVFLS